MYKTSYVILSQNTGAIVSKLMQEILVENRSLLTNTDYGDMSTAEEI